MSNKPDLRDYVDVAARIASFKAAHPEGSLQSDIVQIDDKRVIVKAYAYRSADDARPGVGHAAEQIPGATPYTRGSEVMVCETSAWGRAIAALGFEVKRGVATREEVELAQGRQLQPAPDERIAAVWEDDAVVLPAKAVENVAGAMSLSALGNCPRHRMPWKFREGTSAKGPYAFWSCQAPKDADGYCKERPAKTWEEAQL